MTTGDRVRLTRRIRQAHRPRDVWEPGTVGRLGCIYRTQDGVRIWEFYVGGYWIGAVPETHVEPLPPDIAA